MVEEDDGSREIDDWQPRANLKKLFKEGKICLEDKASIQEFAHKFCVEEKYVVSYVRHLKNLQILQNMRSRSRKQSSKKRQDQTYDQYDWKELVMNGKLGKLLVSELDKYLTKHKLSKVGKKPDKVAAISCHVMRSLPDLQNTSDKTESEDELTSESDTEIVVAQVLSESESETEDVSVRNSSSDTESDAEQSSTDTDTQEYLVTQTRSGRRAGSWKNVLGRKS